MKPVILLALAAFAAPAIVTAQGPMPPAGTGFATASMESLDGTATTTTVATIQVSSCPVAMRAKQGSGSGLVKVRKNLQKDPEAMTNAKPGQQIHLILGKISGADISDPGQITGATVTAKGLSARDRLDRSLDLSGDGTSDLRRTVSVRFSTENDGTASADLSLPGFTSVNSIKLESLNLKDGSTWTLGSLKACIVTPDRIMLIANQ